VTDGVTDDIAAFGEEQPAVLRGAEGLGAVSPQHHQKWREGRDPDLTGRAVLQPSSSWNWPP
jgi:hypothetical protein